MEIFQSSTLAGGGATSSLTSSELSESGLGAGLTFRTFGVTTLTVAVEIDFAFGGTSDSLSELELAAFFPFCSLPIVGLTGADEFCKNLRSNFKNTHTTFAGGGATSSSSELSESGLGAGFAVPTFGGRDLTVAVEMDFGFGGTSESLSELESAAFLLISDLAIVGLTCKDGLTGEVCF
jgi:hypothetical protein